MLMQARTGHVAVLRELAPYIWPADRPDLRRRVVFALIALVLAKAVTLTVPIAYKMVVDLLTGEASGKEVTAIGLAASPVFLIIAYGVGRVLMVLFAQFRDVWFTNGRPRTRCASSPTAPSGICTSCRCAFTWSAGPAA